MISEPLQKRWSPTRPIPQTRPLNPLQRKFAQLIAKGDLKASDAYQAAYKGVSKRTAATNSAKLLEKPKVAEYIKELRAKAETECVMSIEFKRRLLAEIVRTPIGDVDKDSPLCQTYTEFTGDSEGAKQLSVTMLDKLKALDMDNRLEGHYGAATGLDGAMGEFLARIRKTE